MPKQIAFLEIGLCYSIVLRKTCWKLEEIEKTQKRKKENQNHGNNECGRDGNNDDNNQDSQKNALIEATKIANSLIFLQTILLDVAIMTAVVVV